MSTHRRSRISRQLPDYLRPMNPKQRLGTLIVVFVAFVVLIERGQPAETALAYLLALGLVGAKIVQILDNGLPHGSRIRLA